MTIQTRAFPYSAARSSAAARRLSLLLTSAAPVLLGLAGLGALAPAASAQQTVSAPSSVQILPGLNLKPVLVGVVALPDLVVDLVGLAGGPLGAVTPETDLKITVKNIGGALAVGSTATTTGYMVDLILSTDRVLPPGLGYATTGSTFAEDMLVVGGRISNTPNVAPGQTVQVQEGSMTLPADLRPGTYYLCAKVNTGERIREQSTANNAVCKSFVYGQLPAGKPDLVVTGARVQFSGVCKPGNIWANAFVTVRNIGTAPTPAVLDKGIVQVVDDRDSEKPSGYRGGGVGLAALLPGQSRIVRVPVAYPSTETGYSGQVVSYLARVNFGGWIAESDNANNRLEDRITFTPVGCP